MDKYEYNIKAEQITKLIGKKDFSTAAKIADNIDWRRVRNVNMLTNVGTVYAEVQRYEDAKELFLMAFERAPISRRLAYKLTEVCIRAGEYEEAEHYYEDFVGLAPRDSGRYELQYKLAKKKGEPIEALIAILSEYKRNDFDEMWAYELARLYHKAGMGQECVAACDEIILWFGEGEYVEKAMELKMLYMPLSPSQQEKYNKRFQLQMRYPSQDELDSEEQEEQVQEEQVQEQIPDRPISVSTDKYNTADIQEVIAESMKEIMPPEEGEGQEAPNMPQQGLSWQVNPEQIDILGATKDLRKVQRVIAKNSKLYPPFSEQEATFRVVPREEFAASTEESYAYEESAKEPTDAPADKLSERNQETYDVKLQEEQIKKRRAEKTKKRKEEIEETPVREEQEVLEREEVTASSVEPVEEKTVPSRDEIQQNIQTPGQLSEERRHVFAAFLHINGLEEQLARIFEEAERLGEEKETSLFGNILIIGDHKSGKTTLATELMKSLSRASNRKNRKLAKISGDRLNHKGIQETISRLTGADLLIERAGEMNQITTQALLETMAGYTGGMVVVLEDTKEGMARLITENPDLEERFTHKLILKEYEISEWVEMAKQYAAERDYGIDEMATLALSAKIDALYAQKTVVEMEDVRAIIDVAIEHSEKKNIKKLFETVFSRKYKDSDLTMLRENDFI